MGKDHPMTQQGGKTVYGATLGILMLETRFPRVPGDIGNAQTWPFPVQFRRVKGATPARAVRADPMPLLDAFITEGRELVEMGCDGIATNCGFLIPFQANMSAALGVPVATSSLLQVPMVQSLLPQGQSVGILTISAETFGQDIRDAAGIPPDVPVRGTGDGSVFTESILTDAPEMDIEAARADNLAAAQALVRDHPEVGAIVLECTNMVPFARDIRLATGRPVFSIYSCLVWFQAALLPKRFERDGLDSRLQKGF